MSVPNSCALQQALISNVCAKAEGVTNKALATLKFKTKNKGLYRCPSSNNCYSLTRPLLHWPHQPKLRFKLMETIKRVAVPEGSSPGVLPFITQ